MAADIGPADLAWLDGLRREHYPVDRNRLPAHLTMFRHLAPSILPELKRRLAGIARGTGKLRPMIGEPVLFDCGVALRVRCSELEAIREELAEAFQNALTPPDRAAWRPHVTIQNKVERHEAEKLHARMLTLFPRTRSLAIPGLSIHLYQDGPWERIARYPFAG